MSYRIKEDNEAINISNELQEMVFQLAPLLATEDLKALKHHMNMAIAVLHKVERRGPDRRAI